MKINDLDLLFLVRVCVCVWTQHSRVVMYYFPSFILYLFPLLTHRSGGQHGGVVVDILDSDDGSGCVGKAKVQVALHVGGLHDDGILRHFL